MSEQPKGGGIKLIFRLLEEAKRDVSVGDFERAAKGCDYCAQKLRDLVAMLAAREARHE